MDRTLEVACEGTASNFAVRKLSRATLYGTRRRVPVDAEGRPCRAAALTRDGRFLLPAGSTATLHLDDQGDAVERGELRPARGSQDAASASEPHVAEATELLGCTVRQVYALVPVAVSGHLDNLLASTGICRVANRVPRAVHTGEAAPEVVSGPIGTVHCEESLGGLLKSYRRAV